MYGHSLADPDPDGHVREACLPPMVTHTYPCLLTSADTEEEG
jgi:hypothetical protein